MRRVEGRDLGGGVDADIQKVLDRLKNKLPRVTAALSAWRTWCRAPWPLPFAGLGVWRGRRELLIYLLIVVNFQSWLALHHYYGAAGSAVGESIWILLLHIVVTLRRAVSRLGLRSCGMGVRRPTVNSDGLVRSAKPERRTQFDAGGMQPDTVAHSAACSTALAMIIGMVPLSLDWVEAERQNSPWACGDWRTCCRARAGDLFCCALRVLAGASRHTL